MAQEDKKNKLDKYYDDLARASNILGLPVAITGVLVAVAGGIGSLALYKILSKQKHCSNLYRLLKNHKIVIKPPIVDYKVNPFNLVVEDKCLIIEGPNKIGKTTLFSRCIPWYRRFGPFTYQGIVLNGAGASYCSTFREWLTNQTAGNLNHASQEISTALISYRDSQWWRVSLEEYSFGFIRAKRAYVIVDQLEELIKAFPSESLAFVNVLANDHVRNNLAYVFLVVNSSHATKSIINLNQGTRFNSLKIIETADKLPDEFESENVRFIKRRW